MVNSGLMGGIKDFDKDSNAYVYFPELVKDDVIIFGQDFAKLNQCLWMHEVTWVVL